MNFDSAQPIWQQLVAEFTRRVIIGEWKPGMKIPSTRELALAYKVNPNTVQRALAELDRNGTTRSERTSGRYVTGDHTSLDALRDQSAQDIVDEVIARLKGIGVSQSHAIQLLNEHWSTDD
ncbi:GntR family transcriptional regulator [Enteractinococcus helveticum]|uniref:GntR family transcriptional regulator n=1 Tax=Enteractinococcus helveticum TaxID=1837282 RepID=A0A1B7LW09_9MICC|nr:GntR family transcriptional regulator [Enteractinococcus helveticum]OAV59202.1 GntR family transcriptional regulator [Enteractinococcus helveticum]